MESQIRIATETMRQVRLDVHPNIGNAVRREGGEHSIRRPDTPHPLLERTIYRFACRTHSYSS